MVLYIPLVQSLPPARSPPTPILYATFSRLKELLPHFAALIIVLSILHFLLKYATTPALNTCIAQSNDTHALHHCLPSWSAKGSTMSGATIVMELNSAECCNLAVCLMTLPDFNFTFQQLFL